MSKPPIDALKALAHPTRFSILQALKSGERNVGDIEEASGVQQPALSQQLAVLRNAGLVLTRRDAKLVYYSLSASALLAVASAISDLVPLDDSPRSKPGNSSRIGAAVFARMG